MDELEEKEGRFEREMAWKEERVRELEQEVRAMAEQMKVEREKCGFLERKYEKLLND